MNKYFFSLIFAICGLILIFGFGIRSYASHPCLTEVLSQNTDVTVVLTYKILDYQIKKGETLGIISDEFVNKNDNVLKKKWELILPSTTKPSGVHTLKDKERLVVQAPDGHKLELREKSHFNYNLPEHISGYKITIEKDTSLIPIDGTDPIEYNLGEDITVPIKPPENYLLTVTVPAKTVVDRIPGTSSMGTTLTFEPQKAPTGEHITLTIAKSDFDFSKAQFSVCLRKQKVNAAVDRTQPEHLDAGNVGGQKIEQANHEPFIASMDVERIAVQMGEAQLRVRIPEINESGPHEAVPVDLLAVAIGPDGKLAEVMSKGLSISSRSRAVWCWIIAIVIPWLVTGIINGRREPKKMLRLDPIWFVSGKYGNASLSLAQILLWSILVFSASFYVLVVSGKLLDLTDEVLMLLGIAGGTSLIAKNFNSHQIRQ